MTSINVAIATVFGCFIGLLVLGLYPGGIDAAPGYALLGLCLGALSCALLARHDKRLLWSSLIVAGALLGCALALLSHRTIDNRDISYYNVPEEVNTYYFVMGTVANEPVLSGRSQQVRLSAKWLRLGKDAEPLSVEGEVLAILPRYPEYSYGENLLLHGKLTVPPRLGAFDYAAWLGRQGVFSYMTFPGASSLGSDETNGPAGLISAARARARTAIQRSVREPQASLAVGVLIGDRTAISDRVKESFSLTNTTHILAISGQNITLMVGLIWLAWAGPGRKKAMPAWLIFATILLIACYAAFTGGSPSVVRATVMGAILLFARIAGRRYDPEAALALSAAGMVLLDPDVLADVGFQLSFLAMWGIVTFGPPMMSLFSRVKVPGIAILALPLTMSIAAQAATMPVTILLSGRISPLAPLATLTADLSLPPLMLCGILVAFAGLISFGWMMWLAGIATWASAAWLLWWVEWWAALPWMSVSVEGFQESYAFGYYALLLSGVWLYPRVKDPETRWSKERIKMAGLAAMAVSVWVVVIVLFFVM